MQMARLIIWKILDLLITVNMLFPNYNQHAVSTTKYVVGDNENNSTTTCNYQLSKSIVHEIKFGDIAVV